ncbi:MAG: PIN domain-containing protein [Chitinivibrionales bacterium]|nr:PIN domain-containing protein [Chitinivibrionales bacterium]
MNILFDTNIIMDALTERKPFDEAATLLLNEVESSTINGFLSAISITTIYYLIQKTVSKQKATSIIKDLVDLFEIAPVNRSIIGNALQMDFNDFEDAVLYQSAIGVNADGIVTRDLKGFRKNKVSIYSPHELLAALS